MIVRRMLLSDLALQEDCLLVYCAVAWRTHVLMRMRAITASLKVCFKRFAIQKNDCSRLIIYPSWFSWSSEVIFGKFYQYFSLSSYITL